MKKVKIGILGCGYISDFYLKNFTEVYHNVEVYAVCDTCYERAQAAASKYKVPYAVEKYSDMLKMDELSIILNLTNPKSHMETSVQALEAGKHVYIEKPFVPTRNEAKALIQMADARGLRIGCAPDTFLASGAQTTKKLIEDGWIGKPFAVFGAFCHQPQTWHKNAAFLFQPGAGPLYDGVSYYIATYVNIFGPVKSVSATMCTPLNRIQPTFGDAFQVEVPTYLVGNLTFESGLIATVLFSFNVLDTQMPKFEIFGTQGTLHAPLPNAYSEPIFYKRQGMADWMELPNLSVYREYCHGLGVSDMASAILHNREHRTNATIGYHILDVMQAFEDSAREGRAWQIESTCTPAPAVPLNLAYGEID